MKLLKELKVDKKTFRKTFIYTVLFFGVLYVLGEIFRMIMAAVGAKIPDVSSLATLATEELAATAESFNKTIFFMFFISMVFIFLFLYSYSFFENLSWNTIFKKKTTFRSVSKFLGLNIVSLIVLSLILLIISFLIFKLPTEIIKFGVVLLVLAVIFSFYLLYVSYVSFAKTQKVFLSVKNMLKIGIKRIDLTIIPLIAVIVVAILVNIVLYLLSWMPDSATIVVQFITFSSFMSWVRLYASNSLKSVKF